MKASGTPKFIQIDTIAQGSGRIPVKIGLIHVDDADGQFPCGGISPEKVFLQKQVVWNSTGMPDFPKQLHRLRPFAGIGCIPQKNAPAGARHPHQFIQRLPGLFHVV